MSALKTAYRVMRAFFAGFGLLIFTSIAGFILLAIFAGDEDVDMSGDLVLTHQIQGNSPDFKGDDLQSLLNDQPSVMQLIAALDAAGSDPKVKGLVVTLHQGNYGLAQVQELRAALARFRDAGKFARIWTTGFGELDRATADYWLATGFERIDVQPLGMVGVGPLGAQTLYFGKTLNEAGVQFEVEKRGAYKSLMEMFTETGMTEPTRQNLTAMLQSLDNQIVGDLTTSRSLTEEQVRKLLDGGPYVAAEALESKLIDGIQHYDEVKADVVSQVGEKANWVQLEDYGKAAAAKRKASSALSGDGQKVALIPLTGGIVKASGQASGPSSSTIVGPLIADAIREAVENEEIGAFLIRIDSGGGSVAGSEVIRRAIEMAREADKPVVISFGNISASGGYFLSVNADRILAQPATLTGSIGVIAGKPEASALLDRLGVGVTTLMLREDTSPFLDVAEPFSETERQRLSALIDAMYQGFQKRVLDGRKQIAPEAFDGLAQGRVFTGAQALELGLVDKLGGMHEAKAELRDLMGLEADAHLSFVRVPEADEFLQILRKELGGASAAAGVLKQAAPMVDAVRGQIEAPAMGATMPPIRIQ
ncbi:MAG: S49 family peptidase [Alphaproteobacteria bacterium]